MVTCSDGDIRIHEKASGDEVFDYLDFDEDTNEMTSEPFEPGQRVEPDPNYWKGNRVLIIKGEVVAPRLVPPVTMKYELP